MSVVAPQGFSAAGVASGIKPDALDVAVLVSDVPAVTAAVFTQNQAAAAPVLHNRLSLGLGTVKRGVVINSGCANAATGDRGMVNAAAMAARLATAIGCATDEILVCSTGTIGPQLPMGLLLEGIDSAALGLGTSPESSTEAATAILTTDSVPKESLVERDGWKVGGMSKGSGMIRPDMATMLAFITTDAVVGHETLSDILMTSVDATFNSLNIDGCESTNDTVIVMASAASGLSPESGELAAAIESVCRDLARQMAEDAEGASRVVTVDVIGAHTNTEARSVGRTITDSALVRASFYGGDANWGRVLGALGTSDVIIDPGVVTIAYQDVPVFLNGIQAGYDEQRLLASIETGDFGVTISLGNGRGQARIVTTDLTPEYVTFNGERS